MIRIAACLLGIKKEDRKERKEEKKKN